MKISEHFQEFSSSFKANTKVSKIIKLRVFDFSIHFREGRVEKETKLYRFSLLFLFFKISYSIKIKLIAETDSFYGNYIKLVISLGCFFCIQNFGKKIEKQLKHLIFLQLKNSY